MCWGWVPYAHFLCSNPSWGDMSFHISWIYLTVWTKFIMICINIYCLCQIRSHKYKISEHDKVTLWTHMMNVICMWHHRCVMFSDKNWYIVVQIMITQCEHKQRLLVTIFFRSKSFYAFFMRTWSDINQHRMYIIYYSSMMWQKTPLIFYVAIQC